jgi:uncharacterized protein YcfL
MKTTAIAVITILLLTACEKIHTNINANVKLAKQEQRMDNAQLQDEATISENPDKA